MRIQASQGLFDIGPLYVEQQERIKSNSKPVVPGFSPYDYLSYFTQSNEEFEDVYYRAVILSSCEQDISRTKIIYDNMDLEEFFEWHGFSSTFNFNPNI